MANQPIVREVYGLTQALTQSFPIPIKARRAPTANDTGYQLGQVWIYNSEAYILVNVAAGAATWTLIEGSGGTGAFTTLTSSGNTDLANGAAATSAEILNGAITGAASFEVLTANVAPATVDIATSTQANVVTIGSQTGAAATTIQSGTGNILLDSASSAVQATSTTVSAAATTVVNDVRVGIATYTGLTTASAATEVLTLTNALITATSHVLMTVNNGGANDARMTLTRLELGAGSATITLVNNGAAALNGDIQVSFWVVD